MAHGSPGIAVPGPMPQGKVARSWVGRTLGPMARGSLRGSIFMFMSSAIGPGALLLPYMFRLVGVPGGLFVVAFGAFCVAQSLRFIVTIAHLTGRDSYPAGVSAVLGPAAGSLVCHITNSVLVLGMGAHLKFLTELLPFLLPAAVCAAVPSQLLAMLLVFPFCASRDISALRSVAIVSPVALIYVIVLIISRGIASSPTGAAHPQAHGADAFALMRFGDGGFWGLPQAWSILLNAVTCHHVAVPVYKQLHMAKPQRINKVVMRATMYLCGLYCLVGVSGFLAHGRATPENILLVYPTGDAAALVAQALVGSTLLVAIPLNMHAVRDQVTERLPPGLGERLRGTASGRCVITAALLMLTVTISNAFPNVTSIIGIACGFGLVLYIFVVPSAVMCTLRWGKFGGRPPGRHPSLGSDSLAELLLSSPLSTPLIGTQRRNSSGMVSPKLSSSDLKRLDGAEADEGLADESYRLPEAVQGDDGSLIVVQDIEMRGDVKSLLTPTATAADVRCLSADGFGGGEQAEPERASPPTRKGNFRKGNFSPARRDYSQTTPPRRRFSSDTTTTDPAGDQPLPWSRSSSQNFSREASEYPTVSGAEWSVEFALAVAALLLASGLGLASAARTVAGLVAGKAV